ncbi:MAG: hypothetical protein WCT08_01225 [Patescibacteria group bacterium]|jgi:hypothetical protein
MGTNDLREGIETFTAKALYQKVATLKGLQLSTDPTQSLPMKEYELDDPLLAVIEAGGIKRQPRPDCRDETFTLLDQNPKSAWSASSNYWNFKFREDKAGVFDLQISPSVKLCIDTRKRGIILTPQAHGTFLSPANNLTIFRMFKILTEHDAEAPALAKELAASDGEIVVTWTELGLGGIRKASDLFREFSGNKDALWGLNTHQRIFQPDPSPFNQKDEEELFVIEPAQPKLFNLWQAQLEKYRASLVL